jgi:hypothetical protein
MRRYRRRAIRSDGRPAPLVEYYGGYLDQNDGLRL